MAKGKKTGGRVKGSRNKFRAGKIPVEVADGETPLSLMLRIMRDATQSLEIRMAAAHSALPYCHHRLAAIQHTGPNNGPILTQSEVVITWE